MLGKGLESLIPQKGGAGNGDGSRNNGQNSAGNQPMFDPHFGSHPAVAVGAAQSDAVKSPANDNPPPLELPVFHDEEELPEESNESRVTSGEEEKMLPEGKKEIQDSGFRIQEERVAPPSDFPIERGGANTAVAPTQKKSEPAVGPLSQSSISVAARNVNAGSGNPTSPFVSQKNGVRTPGDPAVAGSVFHLETDKIVPNPSQPRRHFDEAALQDLAYSIREFGVLQPLVVTKRKHETPGGLEVDYELIAGERRLMAAKLLGLKTVPAIIRNVDLEREKLELAVIENIQREQLNAIETARAFERLRDEFKMTQREIAAKLGKSREVVANTVRLLDLPGYAQEAIEKGELSESHARFLLSIDDQDARKKLFDDILAHGLTVRDVKGRVSLLEKTGKKRGRPRKNPLGLDDAISPELRAIQDELSSELGAPVEIEKKSASDAGKITITFYSSEELEGILEKLRKDGE